MRGGLTRQSFSVNEGLEPVRCLDIEQIKKHVKDNFLAITLEGRRAMEVIHTRVSSEGIRRASMIDRIADMSSIQKYIRPATSC
jgi:hypothetical protein